MHGNTTPQFQDDAAWRLVQEGQYDEARNIYQRSLDMLPPSPSPYRSMDRAELLHKIGLISITEGAHAASQQVATLAFDNAGEALNGVAHEIMPYEPSVPMATYRERFAQIRGSLYSAVGRLATVKLVLLGADEAEFPRGELIADIRRNYLEADTNFTLANRPLLRANNAFDSARFERRFGSTMRASGWALVGIAATFLSLTLHPAQSKAYATNTLRRMSELRTRRTTTQAIIDNP